MRQRSIGRRMGGRVAGAAIASVDRQARLRWVYLVLGGALLMPFYLVTTTAIAVVYPSQAPLVVPLLGYVAALPMVAVTGLFPIARTLEVAMAKPLLGGYSDRLPPGPATSWESRRRSATWFFLHLAVGGALSALSLASPPVSVALVMVSVTGSTPTATPTPAGFDRVDLNRYRPIAWIVGLVVLAALIAANAVLGKWMAMMAPRLLGPSASQRLAFLEQQTARLTERNRLARELHDSVGHALNIVTVQAAAAQRLLDRDPAFVREALGAIESTTRDALEELDQVLGILRDQPDRTGPAVFAVPETPSGHRPTLVAPKTLAEGLDRLLSRSVASGLTIRRTVEGDLASLPVQVSREAYKILREGLTNAIRHAGPVPVTVRIAVRPESLFLAVTNELTGHQRKRIGGRGLAGIAERAESLGGTMTAGPTQNPDSQQTCWSMNVELPL